MATLDQVAAVVWVARAGGAVVAVLKVRVVVERTATPSEARLPANSTHVALVGGAVGLVEVRTGVKTAMVGSGREAAERARAERGPEAEGAMGRGARAEVAGTVEEAMAQEVGLAELGWVGVAAMAQEATGPEAEGAVGAGRWAEAARGWALPATAVEATAPAALPSRMRCPCTETAARSELPSLTGDRS